MKNTGVPTLHGKVTCKYETKHFTTKTCYFQTKVKQLLPNVLPTLATFLQYNVGGLSDIKGVLIIS